MKHTVLLECKQTLHGPQLTSQGPCSCRGDSWIVCLVWEADTTVILSIISPLQLNWICVTLNQHSRRAGDRLWLCQNTRKLRNSCFQCSRIYLHTRPLAVSKGLWSFWVTGGCTTSPKVCLSDRHLHKQPVSTEPQHHGSKLPGPQGRWWNAPRVAFMHRSITGQGSSTKHWPCFTSASQGQTQTLIYGFWGTQTFTNTLSRQLLMKTLCNKGSGKLPFHKWTLAE